MVTVSRLIPLILPVLLMGQVMADNYSGQELIGGDVRFHGTVVALPCNIAPEDQSLLVDFEKVSMQSLKTSGKSTPKSFAIHLTDCNTAVYHSVTVTLSGTENSKLPNHLEVNSGSADAPAGFAIGINLDDGRPVELNKPTPATALTKDPMQLRFMAYLEVEKEALKNGSIQFGPFTSSANYTLNYQ